MVLIHDIVADHSLDVLAIFKTGFQSDTPCLIPHGVVLNSSWFNRRFDHGLLIIQLEAGWHQARTQRGDMGECPPPPRQDFQTFE